MTFEQPVMIRSLNTPKTRGMHAEHGNKNKKIQNMIIIKGNSSKKDSIVKKMKKKPSYRVKRSTWFEKDEYEKILKLFQEHYPKDFPKKEMVDSIPTIEIRKKISKEKKIQMTNVMICRFLYQYITVQQNKSLSSKKYKNFKELMQKYYPKDFAKDYSKTPTRSIFNKVKKEKKIKIFHLTMCRFFNQYLKKQKSFLNNQEKKYSKILKDLQTYYPNAFPKNKRKLLKLGIFEDIQNDRKIHVTEDDLKALLNNYTKSEDYLQCYFTNPVRHDLKGNIVAPTTPKERFFAKKTLKKSRQK